jgi:hypothetical protein
MNRILVGIKGVVDPKPAGSWFSEAQLKQHLGSRMAHCRPPKWVRRQDLSTHASGKLDRGALGIIAQQLMTSSNAGAS